MILFLLHPRPLTSSFRSPRFHAPAMGDIKPDVVANDRFHAILQEALEVYKTRTGHDLDNDKEIQKWRDMSTAEGLLQAVDEIPDRFKKSRDKYKETRKILKACVRPIQVVGSNATSALSLTPFPPAATLFRAGIFLIDACDNVSKAYDCVQELLRQCQQFTQRLEITFRLRSKGTFWRRWPRS